MKLGLIIGYWNNAGPPAGVAEQIAEAERLGFDSMWTAEAYGSDASRRWRGGGAQTSTHQARHRRSCRSRPARRRRTAMAAITLDHLSGGRFILGLGASRPAGGRGLVRPAVPEAARPHPRVRRDRAARSSPARSRSSSQGEHYQMPYSTGGTGPRQAAQVDRRTRCAPTSRSTSAPRARRTSRWPPRSPTAGCRCSSRRRRRLLPRAPGRGLRPTRRPAAAATTSRSRAGADRHRRRRRGVPPTSPQLTGAVHRRHGRQGRSTSTSTCSPGWATRRRCAKIQDLYLAGRKDEAIAAVPLAMVEDVALVGPVEKIHDELDVWRKTCMTTLLVSGGPEQLRTIADLVRD